MNQHVAFADNQHAAVNREVDRTAIGAFRRRLRYACWYVEARKHSKLIAKLVPIIESSFDHPWVAGVELKIRFWPGNETRVGQLWRLYKSLPKQSMHWDAPVTVSVFRQRRGKKRQALCLSMYLVKHVLYVGQIQGVAGTDAPKELRDWPKLFIESCRTLARQEGLRGVWIPKADALYAYRNPGLSSQLTAKARENALRRIRRSMELLYDTNAIELGFVSDGAWFKWET